jgi:hypothetical protein
MMADGREYFQVELKFEGLGRVYFFCGYDGDRARHVATRVEDARTLLRAQGMLSGVDESSLKAWVLGDEPISVDGLWQQQQLQQQQLQQQQLRQQQLQQQRRVMCQVILMLW